MKKSAVIVALFFMGFISVNAQGLMGYLKSHLELGVKGETNYSGFLLKDMDGVKSEMGIGGNVGTFIKLNISEHFAIQEDILFSYQSSKIKQNGSEDTYQYFGTEVPIYLMGQWNVSGGRFYAGAYPYFSLGLSAKMKDADIDLYKKADDERPMKRLSNGLAAQIGYEFSNKIQLNASYKIGLGNTLDADEDLYKMVPHSVSLGIGYRF